jgi:hypothetical protein
LDAGLGGIERLETIRFQLMAFFGTAVLGVLGLALKTESAVLVLGSGYLVGVAVILDSRAPRQSQVFFYRGLQLQRELSDCDPEAFLELHPSIQAIEARRLLEIDDPVKRLELLRRSQTHYQGVFFWLGVLAATLLVFSGFAVERFLGW